MEIKEILQENVNLATRGTTSFIDTNPSLCDPEFGKNEHKYALFTYVPNHIQRRKNREFLASLFEAGKFDEATHQALLALFCDETRVFPGVGRIRGSFADVDSATRRAEYIVQNIDPYSVVMVCSIGAPFPLVESGFAQTTQIVDGGVDAVIREDAAIKQQNRERAVKEMRAREQRLQQEAMVPHKTPLDRYIELRVKYAQVQHTLNEMAKKTVEYKKIVQQTVLDICTTERENPELKKSYFQAYMEACREVGATPPEGFLTLLKENF